MNYQNRLLKICMGLSAVLVCSANAQTIKNAPEYAFYQEPLAGCRNDYEALYRIEEARKPFFAGGESGSPLELGVIIGTGFINPVTLTSFSIYHHLRLKYAEHALQVIVAAQKQVLQRRHSDAAAFSAVWNNHIRLQELNFEKLQKNSYFLANARYFTAEKQDRWFLFFERRDEINRGENYNKKLHRDAEQTLRDLYEDLRQDPSFDRNVTLDQVVDAIVQANEDRIFCPDGMKPYTRKKMQQWLRFHFRY